MSHGRIMPDKCERSVRPPPAGQLGGGCLSTSGAHPSRCAELPIRPPGTGSRAHLDTSPPGNASRAPHSPPAMRVPGLRYTHTWACLLILGAAFVRRKAPPGATPARLGGFTVNPEPRIDGASWGSGWLRLAGRRLCPALRIRLARRDRLPTLVVGRRSRCEDVPSKRGQAQGRRGRPSMRGTLQFTRDGPSVTGCPP